MGSGGAMESCQAQDGFSGMTIQTKRVYEPTVVEDGTRFLVDRLWPRGLKKAALRLDGWLKDVAPSNELRGWFGHNPARWTEFRRRYFAELDRHPEVAQPILDAVKRGPATLLFSARDAEHNNAVALREYLEAKAKASTVRRRIS